MLAAFEEPDRLILTNPQEVTKVSSKNLKTIVLVDLQYPYGQQRVYMSGSLFVTASRLMAIGHKVQVIDLNIDSADTAESLINATEIIGVSVIGSPYIPQAIAFAKKYKKPILFGGQVIAKLQPAQFQELFAGTEAIQICNDQDLANALGHQINELPSPWSVSLETAWGNLSPGRLRAYLQNEFSLVLSQGCHFKCAFCAAEKKQTEQFRGSDVFHNDLVFLAASAKKFGINQLRAYASSLDFFQNPQKVKKRLEILASVFEKSGIRMRLRVLSCMNSFLKAWNEIPNLGRLLKQAGLETIGFGVDGTDSKVWKSQGKTQNKLNDLALCLNLCDQNNLKVEILMVMGFSQDTLTTLSKNILNSFRYVLKWKRTIIRPYLAKPIVPGNDEWDKDRQRTERVIKNPELFYNLDFCAFGSTLTHPKLFNRWICNLAYLTIILCLAPLRRCTTFPLLAQGSKGVPGRIAKLVNRLMPCDY